MRDFKEKIEWEKEEEQEVGIRLYKGKNGIRKESCRKCKKEIVKLKLGHPVLFLINEDKIVCKKCGGKLAPDLIWMLEKWEYYNWDKISSILDLRTKLKTSLELNNKGDALLILVKLRECVKSEKPPETSTIIHMLDDIAKQIQTDDRNSLTTLNNLQNYLWFIYQNEEKP